MKKPDYPKLIFVAMPLSFVFWVGTIFVLMKVSINKNIIFETSYLLTIIFFCSFIFIGKNFVEVDKETENDTNNRKIVTPKKALLAFFIVLFFLISKWLKHVN